MKVFVSNPPLPGEEAPYRPAPLERKGKELAADEVKKKRQHGPVKATRGVKVGETQETRVRTAAEFESRLPPRHESSSLGARPNPAPAAAVPESRSTPSARIDTEAPASAAGTELPTQPESPLLAREPPPRVEPDPVPTALTDPAPSAAGPSGGVKKPKLKMKMSLR